MTVSSRWRNASWQLLGAVFIAVYLLFVIPVPAKMASDPDWAVQLMLAQQVQKGEYPSVDFVSAAGPLYYLPSAIFQELANNHVIGEIYLVVVGYFVGYLLLFQMAYFISKRGWIAILIIALGLILLPKMYKYFIILYPVASLAAIWFYLEKPSRLRLAMMALTATFGGLVRPDFGFYSVIASTTAIVLYPVFTIRKRVQESFILLGIIFLFALPWLLWLIFHDSLFTYLSSSTLRASRVAEKMSLPFPSPNTHNLQSQGNQHLISIVLACLVPIATPILAWRSNTITEKQRKQLFTASLWALLLLYQATHRSDYGHFKQGFTLTLIPLAWLIPLASEQLRHFHFNRQTVLAVLFFVGLILFFRISINLNRLNGLDELTTNPVLKSLRTYNQSAGEMITQLAEQDPNPHLQALAHIHACVAEQDAIATGPSLINFYFMTQRKFRGHMWIAYPGFLTEEEENETIEIYREEGLPAAFIYLANFDYDGRVSRRPEVYLPTLYSFFQENYQIVANFGPYNIAVPATDAENNPCHVEDFGPPQEIQWRTVTD